VLGSLQVTGSCHGASETCHTDGEVAKLAGAELSKEKAMKMRIIVVYAALAIPFGLSAQAFSGDLAGDIKALDELSAFSMKYEDAYKNKNTAALAALFTEDAVCVTPGGLFLGREAIEKASADQFRRWTASSHIYQADQLNAIDNGAWSVGQWWRTLEGQNGPVFARGYWAALFVRENDGWKVRLLVFNETSPRIKPALAQTL
jgi:uncharacterized protein (TIGR02246 family)